MQKNEQQQNDEQCNKYYVLTEAQITVIGLFARSQQDQWRQPKHTVFQQFIFREKLHFRVQRTNGRAVLDGCKTNENGLATGRRLGQEEKRGENGRSEGVRGVVGRKRERREKQTGDTEGGGGGEREKKWGIKSVVFIYF